MNARRIGMRTRKNDSNSATFISRSSEPKHIGSCTELLGCASRATATPLVASASLVYACFVDVAGFLQPPFILGPSIVHCSSHCS